MLLQVVIYTTKVQGESIVEDVLNDLKSKVNHIIKIYTPSYEPYLISPLC